MVYLLLNRFHGALQGAFLGEALGRLITPCSDLSQPLLQDQIKLSCLQFCQEICAGSALVLSSDLPVGERDLNAAIALSSSGIATALPLGLFWHENPSQLAQQVDQLTQAGVIAAAYQTQALAIALAIATALQAQQPPTALISTVLAALHPEQTFFRQQLEQVEQLLSRAANLDQACQQLIVTPIEEIAAIETAITLAIYCFLSTAEDFRLSLLRSLRTAYLPQLTTMLAGALSGAYHGKMGLPDSWRSPTNTVALSLSLSQQTQTLAAPLAEQLWTAWSGYYQPSSELNHAQMPVVTSAPGLLRRP